MIQIDMPMPENCIECPLIAEEYTGAGVYECVWLQKRCLRDRRRSECPLREVTNMSDDYVRWLETELLWKIQSRFPSPDDVRLNTDDLVKGLIEVEEQK